MKEDDREAHAVCRDERREEEGKRMRKVGMWLLALAACGPCFAAGFTQWAVPRRVDVVRNEGIMVYGSFGNANGCTVADQIFVPMGHAQYNQIYSLLLTAMASGLQVQAYSDQCARQDW